MIIVEKYLAKCESPKFYYMNERNEIASIEIVDAYMDEENIHHQDIIKKVTDIESFLTKFESLKYEHVVKKLPSGGRFYKEEHRYAIKI